MKPDDKGFVYPFIDASCCDCGLCVDICPQNIINPLADSEEPSPVAAWCKDNALREKSSSGGIFTLLAEEIIDEGGIVCGAIFENCDKVIHICADNKEALEKIRRSKYLQSDINGCYCEIKNYLECGRKVLFSGTPCQTSGLKSFLSKKYENLYLLDFICHGVPSKRIYDAHKKYLEQKSGAKMTACLWRGNGYAWDSFQMKIEFANGQVFSPKCREDGFTSTMLKNLSLRDSCYECPYTSVKRVSDIMLGDYWRVSDRYPQYNDGKGTSIVYLSTKKGHGLFNRILDNIHTGSCTLEHSLESNSRLERSPKKPENYDDFWQNFFTLPFEEFIKLEF